MLMDFALHSQNHCDLPPTPCTFSHITCHFSTSTLLSQFQVFLNELTSIMQKDIRYFGIRELTNIVHALAKLGERNALIFSAVESNAYWIVENGNAQNIANTAWACAKLNVLPPSLFQSIDENAVTLVKDGTPQAIANVAWACATLNVQSPSLFRSIDENADWLMEKGNAQDIAVTAWACATLNVQSPYLFRTIDENAARLVENGTPQAVANTAWAFAKLDIHAPSLFRSIERSTWLIENGNLQAIAVTRQAFTRLAPSKGRGGGERSKKYRAIELNKRIGELGGDWNGLLDLHQREREGFDNVNWATATSKLGRLRIRAMREMKRDARVSRRCIHCCLGDWD